MDRKKIKKRLIVLVSCFLAVVLLSLLAPVIAPNNPKTTNVEHMKEPPSKQFPLGTDTLGRCVLSRTLWGGRTTIPAAFFLVLSTMIIGTALGMCGGYFHGFIDQLVLGTIDLLLSFPQMVLAVAIAGILGGGMKNALIALGLSMWTTYARLARSLTLQCKNSEYIQASRLQGKSSFYILWKDIFPTIIGSIMVCAATQLGGAMVGIAGLSFLGLGITGSTPEWGSMLSDSGAYLKLAPWSVFAPAFAIIFTVSIVNLIGDTLQVSLDLRGTYEE